MRGGTSGSTQSANAAAVGSNSLHAPSIPNLVLGPDGHTLAVATATTSNSPAADATTDAQAVTSSNAAANTDPVLYTASLNLDDINDAQELLPFDLLAIALGRRLAPNASLQNRTSTL